MINKKLSVNLFMIEIAKSFAWLKNSADSLFLYSFIKIQMIEIIIPLIVCVLLIHFYFSRKTLQTQNRKPTLILLMGSGGHTTEMVKFLYNFRYQDTQNIYIISTTTDKLSQSFFLSYIAQERPDLDLGKFIFIKTKRTNQVKQSKITAIWTTLLAAINSFYIVAKKTRGATHLIGNGPGFCVPFFYIYFFLNKLKITRTRLIFVESWCRVDSLSVSGKLLKYIVDDFLIHWEKQKQLFSNARYEGQLI